MSFVTNAVEISTRLEPLVKSTEEAIGQFGLLDSSQLSVIALSGGKDSIVLSLVLRELGLPTLPAIVDMGYVAGWGQRVASLVEPLGLEPVILTVRDMKVDVDAPTRRKIADRIDVLDRTAAASGDLTPCTSCYSAKILALASLARRADAAAVCLGQHMTDAIASLLKQALMYIDRWDEGHPTFHKQNFLALAQQLLLESLRFAEDPEVALPPLLQRVEALVRSSLVDTDDPPKQEGPVGFVDIPIVRPMFFVKEKAIIEFKRDVGLATEGSGCQHSLSEAEHTPREVVHYQVLRPIESPSLDGW